VHVMVCQLLLKSVQDWAAGAGAASAS